LAYPRYITGEHAAPPADCGGIPGFYAQLEISAIPIIPITKTLRIGMATMIPAASTNRPSRTGSPASPTVAEQRPPEPSNVNQLTLMPLLIARIQLPTASLGYRLAAHTRMVPQPKKDMKGEHPGRDSSFRRTTFEV
jgi:hypothetical protein